MPDSFQNMHLLKMIERKLSHVQQDISDTHLFMVNVQILSHIFNKCSVIIQKGKLVRANYESNGANVLDIYIYNYIYIYIYIIFCNQVKYFSICIK